MTQPTRAVLGTLFSLLALGAARAADNELKPLADAAGDKPLAPWRVVGLPGQNPDSKPFTRFAVETVQGKRALRVDADRSYGNLFHPLPPGSGGHVLSWSWRVDKLNDAADLTQRSGDDTTIKVCAMFDLSLDKVSFLERQVMKSARAKTDDPVPGATLCYVWDNALPAGKVQDSPFTHQLRYVILRSGPAGTGEWQAEKRDIVADFKRIYADQSPDAVPPLIGIAIGADADNTKQHTVAHVADVALSP